MRRNAQRCNCGADCAAFVKIYNDSSTCVHEVSSDLTIETVGMAVIVGGFAVRAARCHEPVISSATRG